MKLSNRERLTFSQKNVTIDTEKKSFIPIRDGSRVIPEGTRLHISTIFIEAKAMKLQHRGDTYEYNPPIITPSSYRSKLTNTSQKVRWLFLEQARSNQRRSRRMLTRSSQEIGLI